MNSNPFAILICTNGNETTRPSLDYGVWLAGVLNARVTLLGVIESPDEGKNVQRLVEETTRQLTEADLNFQVELVKGRTPIVISKLACTGDFLTVVGPLGRPSWQRMIQGRSYRRVLERVCNPVLYIREKHRRLEKILVCTGGLGYAESVLRLSLYLAKVAEASLTLLHVVEPVTLQYRTSTEVHDHWRNLIETNTPQGHNLRKGLDLATATGLVVQSKVRHGNPVHEIIEEVKEGDYDLVGMGSPHSAHSLRHLYMPNVTAEIAESLHRPVLAVRQEYPLISES